jgi:hypothetical protein
MKISLGCKGYQVTRNVGEPVYIEAKFILMDIHHSHTDEIAEAMKRIEQYMGASIMLLRDDGSYRCFYCGVKQDEDAQTCTQCGAPL